MEAGSSCRHRARLANPGGPPEARGGRVARARVVAHQDGSEPPSTIICRALWARMAGRLVKAHTAAPPP
jgi:hypothetical protein